MNYHSYLAKVEERDKKIVRLRTEELLSLQEIADRYGISRQRVHQIVGKESTEKMEVNLEQKILSLSHLSVSEISRQIGKGSEYINKVFEKHGITKLYRSKQKFFRSIKKTDECHYWTGCKIGIGYGVLSFDGKRRYAHRLAWEFKNGKIPKKMFVLHKCDNPSCVNPDHLFLGTHKDNIKDRDKKRRNARGERSGTSKLKASQVIKARKIKHKYPGKSIISIKKAMRVNVSNGSFYRAVNGDTWKHLPLDGDFETGY